MRSVATKSPEQQICLTIHRTRHLLIRQQTSVINAIGAHLAEFGIVAPVGRHGVEQLLGVVVDLADKRLPEVAGVCVVALGRRAGGSTRSQGWGLHWPLLWLPASPTRRPSGQDLGDDGERRTLQRTRPRSCFFLSEFPIAASSAICLIDMALRGGLPRGATSGPPGQ
jgi:hypothetical protein